ncbi:MAG: carbohydrate ABC transporter permease, partial [Chloroflexota bacterium]
MSTQTTSYWKSAKAYRVWSIIERTIVYLILAFGAFLAIFPFYWMVSSSLKESYEILKQPPTFWPHTFTISHYVDVLDSVGIVRAFLNSAIVATGRVLLGLIIATMTGYALAKLEFPGRHLLFGIVLALMMVPGFLWLIPLFLLISQYGMIDTYWGLIIPGCVNSFSIFLMR